MSPFLSVWKILTLSCDESTRLVSESLDRQLSLGERVAVRAHALCCRSCRRYRHQLLFLRDAARRSPDGPPTAPMAGDASLSPEARERMRRALDRGDSEESSESR